MSVCWWTKTCVSPGTRSTFQTPQRNSFSWASRTWNYVCNKVKQYSEKTWHLFSLFDNLLPIVRDVGEVYLHGHVKAWEGKSWTGAHQSYLLWEKAWPYHHQQGLGGHHTPSWEHHQLHVPAAPCRTWGWCSHWLWSCLLWGLISFEEKGLILSLTN